jgi:carboxypeptidase C (cathepsin A)
MALHSPPLRAELRPVPDSRLPALGFSDSHRMSLHFHPRVLALATGLATALLLAGCGGGGGSNGSNPPPQPPPPVSFTDATVYGSGAADSLPSAQEISAVTPHQVTVNGTVLSYTATAGHLTASNGQTGSPEASFFYVAYTLDNQSAATRPVTFFYNGGPGSASVFLHLGSFGPMRLETGDPDTTTPKPFALLPNTQSMLDVTDMVFVDAVGTGFSEAISPNSNQSFWGVDADAGVFRDFVIRYIAANQRAASPKFLFGESYGTPRSAVLANLLEIAGVEVTGVVLQSSILNYNSNCSVVFRSFVNCGGFLPSYAAVGAWYGLDNPSPTTANLPAYIAQMRTFAASQYSPAVAAFLGVQTPPNAALLTQLANLTGLSESVWLVNFNLPSPVYQANLIPGTLTGLYDGRVSAPSNSPLAADGDPSSTFMIGGFTEAIGTYLSSNLGYTTPSTYTVTGTAISTWDFRHDGNALPDTIPDLSAALVQNPRLKVLSVNGYHDLVTPFFQTETDLARLGPSPNVTTHFYVGGHMTYLDDNSLPLEKADIAAFYKAATMAAGAQ